MKRAVTSKKTIAAILVTAALAGSSIAGASHSTPTTHGGKQLSWCPPNC